MKLNLSPLVILSLFLLTITVLILTVFHGKENPIDSASLAPETPLLTNNHSNINEPDSAPITTPLDDPTPSPLPTLNPQIKTNFYINKNVVDLYAQPDQKSERVTQALHGEPVEILDTQGNWLKIALPDQSNYTGWLTEDTLSPLNPQQWLNPLIVAVPQTSVFRNPDQTEVMEVLTMGTIVNQEGTSDFPDFFPVTLVNGTKGYVKTTDLLPYTQKQGSQVSGKEILNTAQKLLNQPYLWGGMSTYGVDCSGFVHTVFKVHGIRLHRDAELQYEYDGVPVAQNDLQPGDLVFFETYKPGPSHLGIYVGNRQFINAASRLGVSYASLDNSYYSERYLGAKRVLF